MWMDLVQTVEGFKRKESFLKEESIHLQDLGALPVFPSCIPCPADFTLKTAT